MNDEKDPREEIREANREYRRLQRHLIDLGTYEAEKERKKAAKARRAMAKKSGKSSSRFDGRKWEDDYESHPSSAKRRRQAVSSDEPPPSEPAQAEIDAEGLDEGLVISFSRRFCTLVRGGELLECFLPSRMAAGDAEVAPGDRARFVTKDDGSRMLHSIVPRRSFLARPDPHNARILRVIAANVDHVVNVVSVRTPPLRPRLIDRYLIAASRGNSAPVICVNKIDLLSGEDDQELECLESYRELGIPIVFCSCRDGKGLDELLDVIRGGASVFVGHSGVGKSSVLKAIVEKTGATKIDGEKIRTADVSERGGRGRHTTRIATLFDIGGGTTVVDTPGIREFGLWDLDDDALRAYFPELEAFDGACYFNDCSHTHEPSCAVKDAVEEGVISKARYETYLRLMDELKEQRQGRG